MVRAAAVLLACSLLLTDSAPATACAPAPPPGEEVKIAAEEAVIVWDPATKTEHFIRQARFLSTARSFGFLVPTPTVPKLSEIAGGVFDQLTHRISPEVRHERETELLISPWLLELFLATQAGMEKSASDDAVATGAPAVRVVAAVRVAGFDATTVEASDPAALAAWLDGHGFAATPQLTAWLARYVEQRWRITAFVVATDQSDPQARYAVGTGVVQMSFQTDRPFYPYREPQTAAAPPDPDPAQAIGQRFLRVHFLSTERYAATLAGEPWSAHVLYAAPIDPPVAELPAGDRLRHATVFDDDSYPRRGIDEVYFAPSTDRAEIRQPPLVIPRTNTIYIPAEAVGGVVAGVVLLVRRALRRRRAASSPPPPASPAGPTVPTSPPA
jgi:hypothetical protein